MFYIDSYPPEQNGRYFTEDIFKCIFAIKKLCILIKISLKFVPKDPLTISQCWLTKCLGAEQATSHHLNQLWPGSLMYVSSTKGRLGWILGMQYSHSSGVILRVPNDNIHFKSPAIHNICARVFNNLNRMFTIDKCKEINIWYFIRITFLSFLLSANLRPPLQINCPYAVL